MTRKTNCWNSARENLGGAFLNESGLLRLISLLKAVKDIQNRLCSPLQQTNNNVLLLIPDE